MSVRDFLRGAASIFDVAGHLRTTPQDSVEEALTRDWRAVGDDLRHAISTTFPQPESTAPTSIVDWPSWPSDDDSEEEEG